MTKNKTQKLTKWEAGNVVVKAADCLGECIEELKDYRVLQEDLTQLRMKISEIFKKHDFVREMGFGI